MDLYFESAAGRLKIIENGVDTGYSEEEATKILSEKAVTAIADMKMGEASATAWAVISPMIMSRSMRITAPEYIAGQEK